MSQLSTIEEAQRCLEENFTRRMAELESQLHGGGPAKDTVAKVAEEFRSFRELMFNMLGLLRQQISECHKHLDIMETRHRRKSLLFIGVPEAENENCTTAIISLVNDKLKLSNITTTDVTTCHRIGTLKKDSTRPILVRFSRVDTRTAVWRAKSALKGSSTSVREFLTKNRQSVFSKARQHFGVKACWTQDGIIMLKAPDGSRHKIISFEDLNPLLTRFPRAGSGTSSGIRAASGTTGAMITTTNTKNHPRK